MIQKKRMQPNYFHIIIYIFIHYIFSVQSLTWAFITMQWLCSPLLKWIAKIANPCWIGAVTIFIQISDSYAVLACKFYSFWESSIAFEIYLSLLHLILWLCLCMYVYHMCISFECLFLLFKVFLNKIVVMYIFLDFYNIFSI